MDKRTAGIKLSNTLRSYNVLAAIELGIFGKNFKQIAINLREYERKCELEMEIELDKIDKLLDKIEP